MATESVGQVAFPPVCLVMTRKYHCSTSVYVGIGPHHLPIDDVNKLIIGQHRLDAVRWMCADKKFQKQTAVEPKVLRHG